MSSRLEQSIRSLRSITIPALAGLVVLGLAACGGDDATGPDVSQKQAEEVAAAVNQGVSLGFGIATSGGTASRAPSALNPRTYEMATTRAGGSYTFDDSRSCPEGGTLSVSGDGTITTSQSQNTTTVEWSWNAQASYSNCGVMTADDEGPFAINTSSPIQYSGNGTVTSDQAGGGTGSFTWNYSGTVDWNEQGGPSGNCHVDLTTTVDFQSNQSSVTLEGSVSGTSCGHDVNRTFSTTVTTE